MAQLGPHGKLRTDESLAWAKVAPVVKATEDLALLQAARPEAIKIGRRIFNGAQQDRYIDNQDAIGLVKAILEFYADWRAPNLYTEVLNEIGKGRNAAYLELCRRVVPMLQIAGLKVLVPSWGTGDWETKEWLEWRAARWAGADGISLHGYWGLPKGTPFNELFTPWNALRYRNYWQPAYDPSLLVVTELGRDKRINDGPNPPVGNGGYIADWLNAEQFAVELLAIDSEYRKDGVVGTPFTNGPDAVWTGYNMDPVVQYLLPHAGPAVLRASPPPEVIVPPAPTPTVSEIYPLAEWTPLQRNFTVGGAQPKIIVLHGTSGLGNPYNWWNREVPSNQASSADFWIPRASGQKIRQYVKLGDTSWSNGPLLKPDISVPFLRWLVEYKKTHPDATGNHWTTSIEFEKDSGNKQGLTAWQIVQGRELIKWLSQKCAIPLDRQHVLGHYQFDSVSRGGCPGPMPWEELLSDYPVLAESYYWGPMWNAINWARGKNRITEKQQRMVHELITADKKAAGIE